MYFFTFKYYLFIYPKTFKENLPFRIKKYVVFRKQRSKWKPYIYLMDFSVFNKNKTSSSLFRIKNLKTTVSRNVQIYNFIIHIDKKKLSLAEVGPQSTNKCRNQFCF